MPPGFAEMHEYYATALHAIGDKLEEIRKEGGRWNLTHIERVAKGAAYEYRADSKDSWFGLMWAERIVKDELSSCRKMDKAWQAIKKRLDDACDDGRGALD